MTALATAAAGLALAATASGQGITVTQEATGVPCPPVSPNDSSEFPVAATVTGGCVEHLVNTEGLVILVAHIFGIESTDSNCATEYTMRVGANGEGYFTNVELSGPNCVRRPCGTAAGTPQAWEIHLEETSSTTARLERHFCIENLDGSGRQSCHYFITLREDAEGQHRYELGVADVNDRPTEFSCEGFTGFRAEIVGHWKFETTGLELVHTI